HRDGVLDVQCLLARADRHREKRPGVYRLADLLGDREGGLEIRVEKHHGEFVAAVTAPEGNRVRKRALQDEGDLAEHRAAREMSVGVVDPLEVVAVEEEEGEITLLGLGEPVDLVLKLSVKVAVVVEGRERVAAGGLSPAPLVEEVLEREG